MSGDVWDKANSLIAEMPLVEAARHAREAAREASAADPERRAWWMRVYWQIEDIYAARCSGAEPVPLDWEHCWPGTVVMKPGHNTAH